jgi:hypothetical protein
VNPTCSRVSATERNRSWCGSSSNKGLLLEPTLSSSSGGGVFGRVSSNRLLLVSGSSMLPSSLREGVDRFKDIGAIVASAECDITSLQSWKISLLHR